MKRMARPVGMAHATGSPREVLPSPAMATGGTRTPPTTEQPAPRPGTGDIWRLVIADMEVRRQTGITRYGTPLQADNGRDALTDAYQEALDMCVYLRQAIAERDDDFARVIWEGDGG